MKNRFGPDRPWGLSRRVKKWLLIFFGTQLAFFLFILVMPAAQESMVYAMIVLFGVCAAAGFRLARAVGSMVRENTREQALLDLHQMELEQLAEIIRQQVQNDPDCIPAAGTEKVPEPGGLASHCPNRVVDALLFRKSRIMKEKGIASRIAVSLPESLDLDPALLMSLVSNLLDNAIRAASHCARGCRQVTFEMYIRQGQLVCRCENTAAAASLPAVGHSTRPEEGHGLGLEILQDLCRQHDGFLTWSLENGRCRFTACLALEKVSG